MCWNQEVSLNTFLFSSFGIFFGYYNNIIGFFELLYFISFASIQLLEYFTWRNLNDKKTNRFLSQIGLFLIFIQIPLFVLSSNKVENKVKTLTISIYLMFSLFCICYFNIDYSMEKASNGHLTWNWLNFPNAIIFIWLSFIFGLFLYQKKYLIFSIYLIIVLSIYYTYHTSKTWGSLWCWVANILSLKLIIQVFLNPSPNNCLISKASTK
jgi:hypothetical protein